MKDILTSKIEYPRITDQGRRLLRRLHEDDDAPRYNYYCGDRLTDAGAQTVDRFAAGLRPSYTDTDFDWMPAWIEQVSEQVPFYRYRGKRQNFVDIPTCSRLDLARDISQFVPDNTELEALIVHGTSGRTARPLAIPHHPAACSSYLPLLQAMLQKYQLTLQGQTDSLAIALVCRQRQTITCATVSTWLNHSGFIKVNLNDKDQPTPGAASRYLNKYRPEIITGDPIAFTELAKVAADLRPKALLSTSAYLNPALHRQLQRDFGCPVINYYSLMESGPLAVAVDGVFYPLSADVYMEILDDRDRPVAMGEPGEITLTGGRNPYLPLLRYRTGDYATPAIDAQGERVFYDLEGRAPVVFCGADGSAINNIDITRALAAVPMARFQLHQNRDRSIIFRHRDAGQMHIRERLKALFGNVKISFTDLSDDKDKVITYSRDR